MPQITYKLSLGSFSISSADDPRTELLAVETNLAHGGGADMARVTLYLAPAAAPGMLEQLAGAAVGAASSALGLGGDGPAGGEPAFAFDVRGTSLALGDELRVELAVDGQGATAFTGEIVAVAGDLERTTVTARTGARRLATTRLNQVYQNQPLRQIVEDLCGQAGVQVDAVDGSASYPYLIAHDSQSLLGVIANLARREGLDLGFGADNKLSLRSFTKAAADHSLYYGIDLLGLDLARGQPVSAGVLVSGESPASSQGTAAWHWLAKDLGPFQGAAGDGQGALALHDGALRTKAAADAAALARLGAFKDGASTGRLRLLGRPAIALGDAVELLEVPREELNGLFKVTAVRHMLSRRAGFLTELRISGQGGAKQAGGDLLGALAGAVGGLGL